MSDTGPPTLSARLPEPAMIGSADGTPIATYDLGGDGDDLLLVHATGFCAGVWLPLAAHLDGHRCAALDVRGHGRSGTPTAGMDWHGTAADVLATVDALGLDRPFGVGHSMGGASLVLAEQARPGTFRGLWLFEPIIFPTELAASADDNPLVAGARRRRADFDSAAAAYANFAAKPPFDALDPQALAAYVEYGFEVLDDGSVTLRCRPETESQTYAMGPRHDAMDHLGEVECPVTVVRGRVEDLSPAALATVIAAGIPAGRLEEHPELGHFGPLEDPLAMSASVRAAVTAAP
jgi:pimeloyl-ACP methyl ester carboxylesterase